MDVYKLMKALKNKKHTGHDRISNEILKCCSPIIEKYLVKAFNNCLEECMKIAKVIPFSKKGDHNIYENYNPISLLTSVSKLFEKLLNKSMVRFFRENKLFSPMQFGFRSKRSCTHSILTITEYMRTQIDKKLSGQACFIDLKKAYLSIDHKVLLQKLYAYSFRGTIYDVSDE